MKRQEPKLCKDNVWYLAYFATMITVDLILAMVIVTPLDKNQQCELMLCGGMEPLMTSSSEDSDR